LGSGDREKIASKEGARLRAWFEASETLNYEPLKLISALNGGRIANRSPLRPMPKGPLAMTADVFEPKFLLLYLFILAAIFVHFRGKVRHGFARQLTDHSTILAPLNALLYAFSAVPNKPLLDVRQFPELDRLRENWKIIRDEGLKLFSDLVGQLLLGLAKHTYHDGRKLRGELLDGGILISVELYDHRPHRLVLLVVVLEGEDATVDEDGKDLRHGDFVLVLQNQPRDAACGVVWAASFSDMKNRFKLLQNLRVGFGDSGVVVGFLD